MSQTTILNHWVPRSYLKRWSSDGQKVSTYQLLVPHEDVPVWRQRSIEYLAATEHLYTTTRQLGEPDAFERWMKTEIEDPAVEPLAKIVEGRRLSRREWKSVTRYVFALDQRTPASYLESKQRWESTLPDILSGVLSELPAALQAAAAKNRRRRLRGQSVAQPRAAPPISPSLPLKVRQSEADESGMVTVSASIVPGREFWLETMRYALTETFLKILPVRWSIMSPHPGSLWFTSDHPVLRLNYESSDRYDFGGGWRRPGSEVIVPLSPTCALYRQFARPHPARIVASAEQTRELQRLVAARAHRQIYAIGTPREAEIFRPRIVDAAAFKLEQEEWDAWHDRQTAADAD